MRCLAVAAVSCATLKLSAAMSRRAIERRRDRRAFREGMSAPAYVQEQGKLKLGYGQECDHRVTRP